MQPHVDAEVLDLRELDRAMRILGMGPYGDVALAEGSFGRTTDHVNLADVMPAQLVEGVLNAVDVPGDGMEVLAEAGVELADRGVLRARYRRRLNRFERAVADRQHRRVAHRRAHIAAVIAAGREHVVVPLVGLP